MIGIRGAWRQSQPDDEGRGDLPRGDPPRGDPPRGEEPAGTPVATLLARDVLKRRAMVSARVVADQVRCVECGTCTYNCPLGVDVREQVRLGLPISDSRCLTCGECVARCPRGVLHFEESTVFTTVLRGEGA